MPWNRLQRPENIIPSKKFRDQSSLQTDYWYLLENFQRKTTAYAGFNGIQQRPSISTQSTFERLSTCMMWVRRYDRRFGNLANNSDQSKKWHKSSSSRFWSKKMKTNGQKLPLYGNADSRSFRLFELKNMMIRVNREEKNISNNGRDQKKKEWWSMKAFTSLLKDEDCTSEIVGLVKKEKRKDNHLDMLISS